MLRNCSARSSFSWPREWRKCERSAKKRAATRLDSNQLNRFSNDSQNARRRALPVPWHKSVEIVMYGLSLHLPSCETTYHRVLVDNRVLHVFRMSVYRRHISTPTSASRSGIRSAWNFRLTLNAVTCSLANFPRCERRQLVISFPLEQWSSEGSMQRINSYMRHLKVSCGNFLISGLLLLLLLSSSPRIVFIILYIKSISVRFI